MPVSSHQVPYDLGLRWSKRLHKAFQQLSPTAESVPSLMTCQAALARMLGHAHWHAFEATRSRPNVPGKALSSSPAALATAPRGPLLEADGTIASDPLRLPVSLIATLNTLIWCGGSTLHLERRNSTMHVQVREHGVLRSLTPTPSDADDWLTWALARTGKGDEVLDLILADRSVSLMLTHLPTVTGELVVMRVKAGAHEAASDLNALSYPPHLVHGVDQVVQAGSGMVLVTGAVGSGMSTTLRALGWALQRHHAGQARITDLTREQDPDRLNTRALEWVRTATSSGPQGLIVPMDRLDGRSSNRLLDRLNEGGQHFVLGRLHGVSSQGALLRLMDLGMTADRLGRVAPRLMVLHQRLVPQACPCRNRIEVAVGSSGVEALGGEITRASTDGCKRCHGLGVIGRTLLVDALEPATRPMDGEEIIPWLLAQNRATFRHHGNAPMNEGTAGATVV